MGSTARPGRGREPGCALLARRREELVDGFAPCLSLVAACGQSTSAASGSRGSGSRGESAASATLRKSVSQPSRRQDRGQAGDSLSGRDSGFWSVPLGVNRCLRAVRPSGQLGSAEGLDGAARSVVLKVATTVSERRLEFAGVAHLAAPCNLPDADGRVAGVPGQCRDGSTKPPHCQRPGAARRKLRPMPPSGGRGAWDRDSRQHRRQRIHERQRNTAIAIA